MSGKSVVACTLVLLVGAFCAGAGTPYVNIEQRLTAEQRQATGLDSLSAQQLELLNRLLADEALNIAKVEQAAAEEKIVMASEGDFRPIRDRLKGTVAEWAPGTVFELENGQRWKVLKGELKLREPLRAPEIVVSAGVAGRWFLQVHEDLPKARVYRVD